MRNPITCGRTAANRVMLSVTILCTMSLNLKAQSTDSGSWDTALEEILSFCYPDAQPPEHIIQTLESLHDCPLNINTADREQLSEIPFLSDSDIEDIHAYIYMHGAMLSLGELQLAGALDYDCRRWLGQLVFAGPAAQEEKKILLRDVLKYGRLQLISHADIPLYTRSGFAWHSAQELQRWPGRKYLGTRTAHSQRIVFNWHDRIKLGISMDKDYGEPFFEKQPPGYDFYSPYLYLKQVGPFQTLAVGRYNLSYGYGLLLGSSFSMGIGSASAKTQSTGIKPHSGTSECGFFTGVAASFQRDRACFSAFLSCSPMDVSTNADGSISSIKTDGSHRTVTEWDRKHNCRLQTVGANVNYFSRGVQFGITALAEHISRSYLGHDFLAGLSAYGHLSRPGYLAGAEISVTPQGIAALGSGVLRLEKRQELSLMLRYYSPDYMALHSGGPAQSAVRNEMGATFAFDGRIRRSDAVIRADLFRHPQPVYAASAASNGIQLRAELSRRLGTVCSLRPTLSYKAAQKDCKKSSNLQPDRTARLKLRCDCQWKNGLSCLAQLLFNVNYFPDSDWSLGRAVNASVLYERQGKIPLKTSVSGTVFNTDSYASAVSVYERGPQYQFGFMTLSGSGCRCSAMLQATLCPSLKLCLKCGSTIYSDRTEIGSSAALISQSHKEDLSLQLTWKIYGLTTAH